MVWSELRDTTHGMPNGWGGYNYNSDIYVLDLDSTENGPLTGTYLVGGIITGLILGVCVAVIWNWRRAKNPFSIEKGLGKGPK
jgi:hypothetical protein